MRMANTCIVYNNDHTRTEKIVQLHEKDIIGQQKNGKYKDGKGIDNDNWADNGKHNDEDKDK